MEHVCEDNQWTIATQCDDDALRRLRCVSRDWRRFADAALAARYEEHLSSLLVSMHIDTRLVSPALKRKWILRVCCHDSSERTATPLYQCGVCHNSILYVGTCPYCVARQSYCGTSQRKRHPTFLGACFLWMLLYLCFRCFSFA